MRNFSDLNEQEVLALAISLEEDDERTYDNYAHYLESDYPDSAAVFRGMAAEEAVRRNEVCGLMHRPSI